MQHVVGYIDPEYEKEMNKSIYQLTSVEPLADDPDYLVYTIKGTHDGRVDFTAGEDSSEEKSFGTTGLDLYFVDGNTGYRIPPSAICKALFFSQPGVEIGVVIGEEADGSRQFLLGKRAEEGKLALLPAAVTLAVCVK